MRDARGATSALEAFGLLQDLTVGTTAGNRQLLGIAARSEAQALGDIGSLKVGMLKEDLARGHCVSDHRNY